MTAAKICIVFLGTQMEIAGAQHMLLSQARWFQKKGYEVLAVFFYDKQGLRKQWQEVNAFPVVSLEARRPGSDPVSNFGRLIRALWRLFRVLKNRTSAVVTFTPHSNLLGLPVAWAAGVPARIGTHHGHIEGSSELQAWFHGKLCNSKICTKLVAVSAQVREYAIQREKVRSTKLEVIENGIEVPVIRNPREIRQSLRAQLGLNESQLAILTVGRLTVQKGHTYLLDAIPQVVARFPQTQFFFAGDGPLREELEKKAKTFGVADSVAFLGIRDDIDKLLFSADIFVQPSQWEGLSLALLEALMAGLPVLATRVEGVVDVVKDGESGLLVPPKDSTQLATALERLITSPELRIHLATGGKEQALKHYSIDAMCNSYEKLIRSLIPNA